MASTLGMSLNKDDIDTILLEAIFENATIKASVAGSPPKSKGKSKTSAAATLSASRGSGQVQLIRRANGTYAIRFIDLLVPNIKRQHLSALLCREKVTAFNKVFLTTFERFAERIVLDDGPDGQLKGSHFSARTFEQPVDVFDIHLFRAIIICKPAAAKPPTVLPDIHVYANLLPYAHLTKDLAVKLESKVGVAARLGGDGGGENLQHVELDMDRLKKSAHDLFRMFDQDRSGAIDFGEFQTMLAYRQLHLLEPQAKRFFALVDEDKGYVERKKSDGRHASGTIDEEEFVAALYMTNYMKTRKEAPHLTPSDVFAFFDGWFMLHLSRTIRVEDRDGKINMLEYELAMKALGVVDVPKKKMLQHFPVDERLISLEAFQHAWCSLIDIRAELTKRRVPPPHLPFSFNFAKTRRALETHLIAALAAQAAEEVAAAVAARDMVKAINRQRDDERSAEYRARFHEKRGGEVAIKTQEAVREREEKIQRRKERNARAKLVQDERRLQAQVTLDRERRKEALMQVRTEALVRRRDDTDGRRAARGDDVLTLANRQLDAIPPELIKGKDALLELSNLIIVDLAHNCLRTLPAAFAYNLDSVQKLDLSFNDLEALPDDIGQLHALRLLTVRHNRLTGLPPSFDRLAHLEILDLASNALTSLRLSPSPGWRGLSSLHALYLADNRLQTLPPDLPAAPQLQHLDLVGNPLARLPMSFSDLGSLVTLDVSNSGLKHLSTEFGGHPQCLVANLSRNALTHLPPSVGQLTALQLLDVAHNEILSLPDAVGTWRELVHLRAPHNRLRLLPDEMGAWEHVECIELSHNRLQSIPDTVGALRHLHTLSLRDNALTTLPLEVGALVSLRHCDLSRNQLDALPRQIGFCHNLVTLDVSENAIAQLPSSVGMWMALEKLHLQHNCLTSPLPETVADWTRLQLLDLSHNRLTHLDRSICRLVQLGSLNLAANRIAFLPSEIGDLTGLETLDLHNNALQALPVELSRLLPTLEVLHVDRNPLAALPEKWCSRWRLQDVYRTQYAHGYAKAEALEWTNDHAVYYPAVVAEWNAHADEFLAHTRLVAAFLDAVHRRLTASWLPRFETPVKAHFFEFKFQGHATVYDDVAEDVRESLAAQAAEREAAREAQAQRIAQEDAYMGHVLDEKYAFDPVKAELRAAMKRERHERRKEYETHLSNQALLEYVDVHATERQAAEERRVQEELHAFAEHMKQTALEQEKVLQRQYSLPDQTKWTFYHRTGRHLDKMLALGGDETDEDARIEGDPLRPS
ncbi:Aste57867_18996 [Aphanomyces stellatus]|uniref:Aste57867_18996 protein n=1 Tax=Aphanomyces stellatus TaxID=120398 RepID=A0A485LCC3_9STRA|nr:hypothetical protein As57867_018932 [Aphanomyces stellatus]VFT95722.1 Aste57867_18996 [Aphanomyces stellatus]